MCFNVCRKLEELVANLDKRGDTEYVVAVRSNGPRKNTVWVRRGERITRGETGHCKSRCHLQKNRVSLIIDLVKTSTVQGSIMQPIASLLRIRNFR